MYYAVDINGNIARLSSLEDNLNTSADNEEGENASVQEKREDSKNVDKDTTTCTRKRDVSEISCNADSNTGSEELPSGDPNKKKKTDAEFNDKQIEGTNEQISVELTTEERIDQIKQKLDPIIGIESTSSIIELLQKWEKEKEAHIAKYGKGNDSSTKFLVPPKGIDDETKYITLPLIDDKQRRKDIHMLIKSDLMSPIAMADTVDKKIRVWHKFFQKQMPNYKKFGTQNDRNRQSEKKRDAWPKNRPNFLRFVLYKENIDTTTAIKDIQRIARVNPRGPRNMRGVSGGVTYAGMKDKRGVTTQFCTVFRKTPEDLMVMNRTNKNNGMGGGNTTNKGSTILRVGSFSYVDKELRLGLLNGNRFDIVLRNVCIDQSSKSAEVGDKVQNTTMLLREAATAMKNSGFINYFGMQRFGKFHDTHLVGIAVLKGDFKTACDLIMRTKPGEQERYRVLRDKWRNRFDNVDMSNDQAVNDAEINCAKEILRGLGRFMNCETSIMHSLARKPRDYKKAFGTIAKHMRSMFLHAYQSILWNKAASHRIEKGCANEVIEGDLVLSEESRSSGLKGKQVHTVTLDDVEMGKYKITDLVLPLVGTRVSMPADSTGDFLETLLEDDGLTLESFKKIQDRELALCGDYRKVICMPNDFDFEIKLYNDPLQPLMKTDLMGIHGEELNCVDVTLCDQNNGKESNEMKVAMVVGFTLPPSAYATVALRELMKRPTSTEYQTELKLEGECDQTSQDKNKKC